MREMKDSGIEWIGKVPSTWNILRNKNAFFCTKNLVGTESTNTQLLSLTTKGIRKKDINNAEGKLPESFDTYQYVRENDIVMCLFDLDCSAVFSGISFYNGMISPAYRVLTCKKSIVPRYAHYWFNYVSDGRKFNHYAKNIRYTISYDEFSTLPILCPDIETQQRLSTYLDDKCAKIDTIIEKQQKIIEKLKDYKLSRINEIVTNVDGIECNLGRISSMKNGLNFNMTLEGNKVKFLGVGDFKDYFVLNEKEMFSEIIITEEIPQEYLLENGDIVFVRSNGSKELVGRAVMVENIDFALTYSGFCIRFRNTRADLIDDKYLLYFFRSTYFRKQLERYSQGSNISNINQVLLSQISIIIPSPNYQITALETLDKLSSSIDSIITKKQILIEKLTEYKKSLIYEVVTGKKEIWL